MNEHKPRIFLCHATDDKVQVRELYHQLQAAGYHPWLDEEDLLPGQDWWAEIKKVLSDPYNLVVVCLTCNSVTKRGVVQREIKRALDVLEETPEGTIYLIPARLEGCQVPDRLSDLHWVDLFQPNGFERLKGALDFELSRRPAPHVPEDTHAQRISSGLPLLAVAGLLVIGVVVVGMFVSGLLRGDEAPTSIPTPSPFALAPVTPSSTAVIVVVTATPLPATDTPTPPTRGDAAAGQELFAGTCAACHGLKGEGVEGLGKDMTASEFIASRSDAELVEFIKVGRAPDDSLNTTGVAMLPKGGNPALSDEHLYDIVAYIRTLQQ
jgi:mono/diheme cytochrome c family protein